MATSLQTEGIVLQAIPYREYDKILTLFTPDQGILKLFFKGVPSAQPPHTVPLTRVEFLYTQGFSSLPRLKEGNLLFSYPEIRNSLEALQSGAKICQALLKSQSPGKAASSLYALLVLFLEKLHQAPETLCTSFLLKILKYEGLLQREKGCAQCFNVSFGNQETSWRRGGERFCTAHAPQEALPFSEEEEKSLFFLLEGRSLSEMILFSFGEEFRAKVEQLFEAALY